MTLHALGVALEGRGPQCWPRVRHEFVIRLLYPSTAGHQCQHLAPIHMQHCALALTPVTHQHSAEYQCRLRYIHNRSQNCVTRIADLPLTNHLRHPAAVWVQDLPKQPSGEGTLNHPTTLIMAHPTTPTTSPLPARVPSGSLISLFWSQPAAHLVRSRRIWELTLPDACRWGEKQQSR